MTRLDPPIYTVFIVAKAEDMPVVAPLASRWMGSIEAPREKHAPQYMLPTALSPTGAAPATDYLCCMDMPAERLASMEAFRDTNAMPITITAYPQPTHADKATNLVRFLASIGRKEVA